MTNYELEKVAQMVAGYVVEALKNDNELLDAINPPKFMGIEQAAEFLGIPINTIYAKVMDIPHVKCGKRLVFSDRELTRWMKQQ